MGGPAGQIGDKKGKNLPRRNGCFRLNLVEDSTDSSMIEDPANKVRRFFSCLSRFLVLGKVISKNKLELDG